MSTDVRRPPRDAGELEGAARDALHLTRVVLAGVEGRPVLANAASAEVEPSDELADEEQIDVAPARRAKVRVHVELGAELEHSLLGPDLGGVELGIADRAP